MISIWNIYQRTVWYLFGIFVSVDCMANCIINTGTMTMQWFLEINGNDIQVQLLFVYVYTIQDNNGLLFVLRKMMQQCFIVCLVWQTYFPSLPATRIRGLAMFCV